MFLCETANCFVCLPTLYTNEFFIFTTTSYTFNQQKIVLEENESVGKNLVFSFVIFTMTNAYQTIEHVSQLRYCEKKNRRSSTFSKRKLFKRALLILQKNASYFIIFKTFAQLK